MIERFCRGQGYYKETSTGFLCRETGEKIEDPSCFLCPNPDNQLACFQKTLQEKPLPTPEKFTLNPAVTTSRWYAPIKPLRTRHTNEISMRNK